MSAPRPDNNFLSDKSIVFSQLLLINNVLQETRVFLKISKCFHGINEPQAKIKTVVELMPTTKTFCDVFSQTFYFEVEKLFIS